MSGKLPTEETWQDFFEDYGDFLDWQAEREEFEWAEEDV